MHTQIVKFDDGPLDGIAAYSTLRLSRHALALQDKAPIRMEFLMMIRRGHFERYVPSTMQQLAEEVIHEGRAPLRGEVNGTRGALDPDTGLEAFYVGIPVYQPDRFAAYEDPDGPVVIAWLVPLFPAEAAFVATHGWAALEDLLVQHDPDVTDWQQSPLPMVNS